MMIHKNTKAISLLSDSDIDCFDIVTGDLRNATLVLYMFIISSDYVWRTTQDLIKENGFTLEKTKSKQYPT